jgi:ammonia channel protein AmtB
MFLGTQLLERVKVDDAVGAVPVHGFAGVWERSPSVYFTVKQGCCTAAAQRN